MRFSFKTLLFCAVSGLCACLPQAGTVGESVRPAGGMVIADGKSNDSNDIRIGSAEEGPVSGPAMSPSEPSRDMAYNSVPSPMPAGTVAPIHDFPGYWGVVAAGERTATCSMPMGLKAVHLRGRIGRHHFADPDNPDVFVGVQDVSDGNFDSGDRLRVIHVRDSKGFYYKDVPLVAPPLVYFDLDIVTSDPSSLRFYAYKRFPDQPSEASLQPCASDECLDDISHPFPILGSEQRPPMQLLNKLEDVTGEDPLPPCIERQMEIKKIRLRQAHILDQ